MQALKVGDQVALIFTTVLDEMTRGVEDEEGDDVEVVDRAYWENRTSKEIMGMVDKLFGMVHDFDPALQLKYNKGAIVPSSGGRTVKVVTFGPRKTILWFKLKDLPQSEEIDGKLDQSGLEYYKQPNGYRLHLRPGDVQKHEAVIKDLVSLTYRNWNAA